PSIRWAESVVKWFQRSRPPWASIACFASLFIGFLLASLIAHSRYSGERLDDRLGDRFGIFVEHEVAAVEVAQIGLRHNLLHEFHCSRQDKGVISSPHDERFRLPILQIGGPLRIEL